MTKIWMMDWKGNRKHSQNVMHEYKAKRTRWALCITLNNTPCYPYLCGTLNLLLYEAKSAVVDCVLYAQHQSPELSAHCILHITRNPNRLMACAKEDEYLYSICHLVWSPNVIFLLSCLLTKNTLSITCSRWTRFISEMMYGPCMAFFNW